MILSLPVQSIHKMRHTCPFFLMVIILSLSVCLLLRLLIFGSSSHDFAPLWLVGAFFQVFCGRLQFSTSWPEMTSTCWLVTWPVTSTPCFNFILVTLTSPITVTHLTFSSILAKSQARQGCPSWAREEIESPPQHVEATFPASGRRGHNRAWAAWAARKSSCLHFKFRAILKVKGNQTNQSWNPSWVWIWLISKIHPQITFEIHINCMHFCHQNHANHQKSTSMNTLTEVWKQRSTTTVHAASGIWTLVYGLFSWWLWELCILSILIEHNSGHAWFHQNWSNSLEDELTPARASRIRQINVNSSEDDKKWNKEDINGFRCPLNSWPMLWPLNYQDLHVHCSHANVNHLPVIHCQWLRHVGLEAVGRVSHVNNS